MSEQYVIVGAGLAGAMAAQTLRDEGFPGRVVLIGDEHERPYERPPLSKGQLLGTAKREDAYVHSAEWYDEHEVELRTGVRVTAVDRSVRSLALADGSRMSYDRLLLATGSRPRRLAVPGAEHAAHLRTLADSAALVERLSEGVRVVVIGAGWIGLEVAAAARCLGATVSVVEAAGLPLQRVLGDEVAAVFHHLHRAHDVTFHFGATVREIRAGDGPRSVVLADGTEIPADLVVVGVGVQPNVELAVAAGLTVADGVAVDASLRTSDPRIFAAGDVANVAHPLVGAPVRVEHWANAKYGGRLAAQAMLDRDVVFDRVPYFYTDQYDLGMEYAGYVTPGGYDSVVFRGDPSLVDGKVAPFVVFWVRGGRVLAGMNVNVWDVQDDIQKLVRAGLAGKTVDVGKLADPQTALGELLG